LKPSPALIEGRRGHPGFSVTIPIKDASGRIVAALLIARHQRNASATRRPKSGKSHPPSCPSINPNPPECSKSRPIGTVNYSRCRPPDGATPRKPRLSEFLPRPAPAAHRQGVPRPRQERTRALEGYETSSQRQHFLGFIRPEQRDCAMRRGANVTSGRTSSPVRPVAKDGVRRPA